MKLLISLCLAASLTACASAPDLAATYTKPGNVALTTQETAKLTMLCGAYMDGQGNLNAPTADGLKSTTTVVGNSAYTNTTAAYSDAAAAAGLIGIALSAQLKTQAFDTCAKSLGLVSAPVKPKE